MKRRTKPIKQTSDRRKALNTFVLTDADQFEPLPDWWPTSTAAAATAEASNTRDEPTDGEPQR